MIYSKKHIGLKGFLAGGLLALSVNAAVFGEVDARALPLTVLFCIFSELAIQFRWRMSVICPHCGFDPVLYIQDRSRAVEHVKAKLAERKRNPVTLLSRHPLLKLPMRKAPRSRVGPVVSTQRNQAASASSVAAAPLASLVATAPPISLVATAPRSLNLRKEAGTRTVTK